MLSKVVVPTDCQTNNSMLILIYQINMRYEFNIKYAIDLSNSYEYL